MNRNDKNALKAVLIWLVIYFGLLINHSCHAQAPTLLPVQNCCTQALDYKAKYEHAQAVLHETRTVGDRLLHAKEARIKELVGTGNDKLRTAEGRAKGLEEKVGTYVTGLRLVAAELDKEEGRTRLFGIGRKAAVRRIRKDVDQLLGN